MGLIPSPILSVASSGHRSIQDAADTWRLEGEAVIHKWVERAQGPHDPTHQENYERLEEVLRLTDATLDKAQQLLRQP